LSSEIEVLNQKSEVSENPENVQETNEEHVIEADLIEESVLKNQKLRKTRPPNRKR
jgi:hypothetical protein